MPAVQDRVKDRMHEIEGKIDPQVAGALTVNATAGGVFTVAPRSMGELMEFAKLMSIAGACVRPAFRGNPGACLAIALQAFKWGADPFAVANKAYITKNSKTGEEQIAYEAQLIHAIVNASPVLQRRLRPVYEGKGETRLCRIVGFVKGEDDPLEYESPPVGKIGVKNSPLWTSDPDQQLYYYATRAWARRYVPEILLGISTSEELRGEIIDLVPEREPRREDFVSVIEQEENAAADFDVVDNDGQAFELDRAGALRALHLIFQDAAKYDVARMVGAWDSNAETINQLAQQGAGAETAALTNEFCELRDGIVERERVAAATAEADRAAAAEAQRAALRGQTTSGHPNAPKSEPATSAPAPAASATVSPANNTFPGDLPAGERLVPRDAPAITIVSQGRVDVVEQDLTRPGPQYLQPTIYANGKANWKAWAMAQFEPKVRQAKDTITLSGLTGDNEDNLIAARANLTPAERKQMDDTIAAQWKAIEAAGTP